MSNTNNAANVSTGKPKVGGSIFKAPLGTTLPTDATTALNNAFKNVGYISEDGVKNGRETNYEPIKAWGGDVVLNSMTESSDKFSFTMIETRNAEVLKTVFGEDNVTVDSTTGAISVSVKAQDGEAYAWVIEMLLAGGIPKRIVIPNGQVTEAEEINYKDDEAVGYGVTVSAIPDSSGNTHYEYYGGTQSGE